MGFEVLVGDGSAEVVRGADTYTQEGPLTTFFRTDPGRRVIDCWSERLASFRTADVTRIRRLEGCERAPTGARSRQHGGVPGGGATEDDV